MALTKVKGHILADDLTLPASATTTTQSASDNTTKLATTAYVTTAIANLADSAPSTLNTLNELAAALGDDANYSTTTTNAIAAKLPLAGGTLTGALTTNGVVNTGTSHNFALNTPNSLRINIDSNNSATDQIFVIGHNQTSVDNNNALMTILESGNVGIGTSSPSDPLVVQSSGSMNGGGTNANSYFTITDGTYSLYHDPNEIFSDIAGTFHIGANHSNGALRFQTGGTSARMDILANGNVGIGTSSPSQALHVAGGGGSMILNESTSWSYLRLKSPNANGGYIQFADADDDDVGQIFYYHGSGGDYMSFTTNAAERMRIDSAGKVRIGATLGLNHLLNLQTASTSGLAQMEFRNTAAGTQIGMPANTNALSIFTGDAERMRIDSSGKVGIGETSPLGTLHVKSSDSGATADASADELVVENNSNTGISILSGTSSTGSIYFGDSGTNWDGYIAYSQSNRKMTLGVAAGGNSMSIDSTGVGIGTSSPRTLLNLSKSAQSQTQIGNCRQFSLTDSAGYDATRVEMGMGYWHPTHTYQPVVLGAIITDDGGQPVSDFYIATKSSTDGDVAPTERFRITKNGHIGFGTTTFPSGMNSSSYKQFKIGGAVFTDSGHAAGHNTEWMNNLHVGSGNDRKYTHAAAAATIQMTGGKIYFRTNDGGGASAGGTASVAQRVQIHSNGRVAIGDHAPETMLDIKGAGYDSILIGSNRTDNTNKTAGISAYMYTNNQVSLFQMFNQNGSNALYYGSADGGFRGLQQHYFYTNSDYNATSGHKLRYVMHGNGSHKWYGDHQGDSVGHFIFSNQNGADGTTTNCTLMVKNGNCQVQIMPWSSLGARIGTRGGGWNSNSNNDVHFTRNDGMQIKLGGSGPVLSNGTAISSDERLKKNITDIADGQLAKINALKVRTFEWKNTDTMYAGTQEGFIAQEVESVIPEAVKEEAMAPDPHDETRDFEGDVKLLKHEVINARLIKAVQELSAKLEAAEARITTLEG